MIRDDDPTHTSAPDTVVDPAADPALDATQLSPGDGPTPPHQIVVQTAMEGLPAPGERVGRYELGQVIGRGGMGVVYRARDPELDRPLAIKVVLPTTASRRSQQRLLDEARAMAKLRHPAVVPVFDVGTTDRGVYVVMPLLAGGTLHDWATAERRSWRDVLARYLAAGRGLAAAHAAGLVHRDFKPRNVLLGDAGEVMVGDFGLAEDTLTPNPVSTIASGSSLEGTPAYMAPEHAAGQPVDARADQFSFCVSLWEGLHGERPTEAATRQGGMLAAALPLIPADRRGAPGWLLSAIARGWESSPDRRWPSMTEMLDHLERRLRRPRRIALGASALGVLGVAAAVVWMAPAKREDPCPDPRARLATAWSPALRTQIETAFTATGLPYAPDTLARILPALDQYAEQWRLKHIEVCRAGSVEKTQSPVLLDQRMACLDRRLAALRVRTTIFAAPTPAVVQGAVEQLGELPVLADCDDSERLLAFPLPSAPAVRTRISELEQQLDDIDQLVVRGDGKQAVTRLESLVPISRASAYPPLHDRVLAELVSAKGHDVSNEPLLRERVDTAARARDDVSAADAWLRLADHLHTLRDASKAEEIEAMLPVIHAAVLRSGSPPTLVADQKTFLARRAIIRGDHEESIRLAREALDLTAQPLAQARSINNLSVALMTAGRLKEALPTAERALTLISASLGDKHPETATYVYRLAQLLLSAGETDRAATLLAEVAEVQRAALGQHPDLAKTLATLANLARARGDIAGGKRAIEEAKAIFEKTGHRLSIASTEATLAEFVRQTDGFDAARPHYERALELTAEVRGKDFVTYAMIEANFAGALADAKRCPEATPLYAHAIDVLQKLQDPRRALILGASAVCERDNPLLVVTTIAKYEMALDACAKMGCQQDMSLSFTFGLGAALHHSERDIRRGLRLIRAARADAVAADLQPIVKEIDAWTTKHRVKL